MYLIRKQSSFPSPHTHTSFASYSSENLGHARKPKPVTDAIESSMLTLKLKNSELGDTTVFDEIGNRTKTHGANTAHMTTVERNVHNATVCSANLNEIHTEAEGGNLLYAVESPFDALYKCNVQ